MSYEEDVNPFRTPAEPTVEDMIDILDEAMVDWLRKHGSSLYVCRDGARLTQDGLLKLASNMRRNLRGQRE